MKNILLLSVLVICSQYLYGQKKVYSNMELHYVDFDIVTYMKIECSDFENHFVNQKDTLINNCRSTLDKLEELIYKLKPCSKQITPDVRAKMYLTRNSGEVDTLCINSNWVLYSNKLFVANKPFIKFIKQLEMKKRIK